MFLLFSILVLICIVIGCRIGICRGFVIGYLGIVFAKLLLFGGCFIRPLFGISNFMSNLILSIDLFPQYY